MHEMNLPWKYYQIVAPDSQQKNWSDCVKHVASVKTYPELLYTLDVTRISCLENFHVLYFFKQGVQPMWEDPANRNGGRIIMEIPLNQKNILFDIWQKTIVFCAIDTFSSITGCVYAEKANYRICLWIGDANFTQEITTAWQQVLNCDSATFVYASHDKNNDQIRKGRRNTTRGKN